MKRIFLSILLIYSLMLSACSTLEVGIETPVPQQGNQGGGQQPQPEPTTVPKNPYAGLIYRLGDSLFKIGADGQPAPLAPGLDPQILPDRFTPRATFSRDGKWMLSWWDWSDLWLVDLSTGQSRNLTNTTDQEECCAQFWPGRSDVILFLTRTAGGDPFSYQLASIQLDGSNYKVVDPTASLIGQPAPAPDGSAIAYDSAGKPTLYLWDGGQAQSLNAAAYGVQAPAENYGLTNPAWSPSGQQIAWAVSGDITGSGQPQGGILVIDLAGQSSRLLHSYNPAGSESGFLPVAWSPNGQWMALFAHATDQPGAWLVSADGSQEILLYNPGNARAVAGLSAFWSPDSQHLLIVDPNTEGNPGLTFFNLSTSQTETLPLPAGALPLAWLP